MFRTKSELGNIFALVIGRGLQIVFSIVSVKLPTTILTPSEMGRQNIFLAIGSAISLLLISPISAYWNRKIHVWMTSKRLYQASLILAGYIFSITIFASLILLFINQLFGIGTEVTSLWLIWIIFSGVFISQIFNTFISSMNFLNFRIWYVFLINLISWGGLLLALILVHRLGAKAEFWYSGAMIAKILVIVAVLPIILISLHKTSAEFVIDNKNALNNLWAFSSPLLIYSLLYFFQSQSYPFIFSLKADEAALGLFAVGMNVGFTPMRMFSTLF